MDRGLEINRVQDIFTGHARAWWQMRYLPRSWNRSLELAGQGAADYSRCHDLDTPKVGRHIMRRADRPLNDDAHEHYPVVMSLYMAGPPVWDPEQ